MKKLSKNFILFTSLILCLSLFVGCAKKTVKEEDEEELYKDNNKPVKLAIIVDSEKENKKVYDSAISIEMEKKYEKNETKESNESIVVYTLPTDNTKTDEINNIFSKIESDKETKVVIISSNTEGLYKNLSNLKKSRQDILTISAQLPDDDKLISENIDLNFKSNHENQAKRVTEMSKILGAEKFFTLVSDEEKNDPEKSKVIKGLEENSKTLNLPFEVITIPSLHDVDEKRAFVSNEIDSLVKKYGKDISIYTLNDIYDQVLLTKIVDKKYIIPEFSKPNITRKMLDILGIHYLTRTSEDYNSMNSSLKSYFYAYGLERRIGSVSANVDSYMIRYAVELGTNIVQQEIKIKKAQDLKYLEKVSAYRGKISSRVLKKDKTLDNLFLIVPDQIIY